MAPARRRATTVLYGSAVLGFGLGALLDVLLFHLVLRWHHLLSARIPTVTVAGLRRNIYYDGLFALGALATMGLGAALVWRGLNWADEPHSPVRPLGALLVGAGAFNLFDGVVDHYVLDLHDVVHGTPALNPHWVGASLLLLGLGLLVLSNSEI